MIPGYQQSRQFSIGPNNGNDASVTLRSVIQVFDDDADEGQKEPNLASRCCSRLKYTWSDENSTLRRMVFPCIVVVYSFIGGGVYYAIEDEETKNGFWSGLTFVNTLLTTIGYGKIYPKTSGGRWFSIFYSLIGIPLTIIGIADVGFILANWCGEAWRKLKRLIRKCRSHGASKARKNTVTPLKTDTLIVADQIEKVEKKKKEHLSILPLPLALLTCLIWFMLSAAYFAYVEDWRYDLAFYFVYTSMATIGFGDLNASGIYDPRTVLDFAFIIIGIAFFSMCLNIVQLQLDSMSTQITDMILREYARALQEGHPLGVTDQPAEKTDTSKRKRRIDHLEERRREERAARDVIRRLIAQKAGWTRIFIGNALEERLLGEYEKRAKMRLSSTQTEIDTRDVSLMVLPVTEDKFTSTQGYHKMLQYRHVTRMTMKLVNREREAIERHVRRITDGYGELMKEISARRELRRRLAHSETRLAASKPKSTNSSDDGSVRSVRSNSTEASLNIDSPIGSEEHKTNSTVSPIGSEIVEKEHESNSNANVSKEI